MDNRITIGKKEATTLLVNMLCTKIFLSTTRISAETAGTAGWIMMAYTCILVFIIFLILLKLYSKFEGRDILDIAELAAGRFGRILTGLIITMFLGLFTATIMREFAEDMKTISLPNSPISFVMFFFAITAVAACFMGLEAITRYNALVVPIIAVGFLLIIAAVFPNYNITYILPILGNGPGSVFLGGLPKISIFSELIIIFMLPPFLKSYKNFKSVGRNSVLISSFFLIVSVFTYLISMPYPSNMEPFIPIYHISRMISFGRFFQRVESVFLVMWVTSAFLYISSGLYFSIHTFAKSFDLSYIRPLIMPFTIIIFSVSFLPRSLLSVINIDTNYLKNFGWIITFGLVAVLLILASLRKDKKKRVGAKVE